MTRRKRTREELSSASTGGERTPPPKQRVPESAFSPTASITSQSGNLVDNATAIGIIIKQLPIDEKLKFIIENNYYGLIEFTYM